MLLDPVRRRVSELLAGETAPGSGVTRGEEIARVLVDSASNGDVRAIRLVFEVLDRLDDFDPVVEASREAMED
jgi:hypothetical protein